MTTPASGGGRCQLAGWAGDDDTRVRSPGRCRAAPDGTTAPLLPEVVAVTEVTAPDALGRAVHLLPARRSVPLGENQLTRIDQGWLMTTKTRLRAATGRKMMAHHLRFLRHAPESQSSFFW